MITKAFYQQRNFATKMMAGSTSNKKDSAGRRLGIKRFGQAEVMENEIVARQRGFKWHPGNFMNSGKDHTLHSTIEVNIFSPKLITGYSRMEQGPLFPQEAYIHPCNPPGDSEP